jgi:hypothetical protein
VDTIRYGLILLFLVFFNAASANTPLAHVEAIQGRAAYERNDLQRPLMLGHELLTGDYITSSPDGRILLRFSDGSTVRIGPNARVKIDYLQVKSPQEKNRLMAGFEVLKGIFRYSSESTHIEGREVNLKAGRISAGIRGTDVFVKVAEDKDWVCLVEGQVQVQAEGVSAILNRPREFFVFQHDKTQPEAIAILNEMDFYKWLTDTEFTPSP